MELKSGALFFNKRFLWKDHRGIEKKKWRGQKHEKK